jgi:hypothetical protein
MFNFLTRNLFTAQVYAQEYNSFRDVSELADKVGQAVNILIFISGAVFIAYLILGAYKFATAQGDPKGITGAKQTLTHAFIGVFVVLGVFFINMLVVNWLGVDSTYGEPAGTSGIFDMLKQGIDALEEWAAHPLRGP